jgi:hypothetical protein
MAARQCVPPFEDRTLVWPTQKEALMKLSATDTPVARKTLVSRRPCIATLVAGAGLGAALSLGAVSIADAADAPSTALQAGPVSLQFSGFTALESVYRDKNETADIGSNFNTSIPFDYQVNAHVTEFRETARQSRFALLAKGPQADGWSAESYMETDFLSAAVTSNSNESNSYTLRVRHFYGVLRNSDSGWYVLGGQNWSLATLYGTGDLAPRSEVTPTTIDAQYATGFNWTRSPQLRFVKTWGKTAAVGISLEEPQAQFANATGALVTNAGGSLLNSGANYAMDFMPDIIVKGGIDPGFGHYEIYGMGRGFRDRYPATVAGSNKTAWGSGVGGGAILPLVGNTLTLQLSALGGKGIGRYGTSGLPDATINASGAPAAISEVDALAGLTYKPVPTLSIYAYYGIEQASNTVFDNTGGVATYGYGSTSTTVNTGCNLLTGTAATCNGVTRRIAQLNLGDWWKVYQGVIGNVQVGLQFSHTTRKLFADPTGSAPGADINMGFFSFRYYPYQR